MGRRLVVIWIDFKAVGLILRPLFGLISVSGFLLCVSVFTPAAFE